MLSEHILSRAQSRLALQRRRLALRPRRWKRLRRCKTCHRRRRLGNWGYKFWHCRPCWLLWHNKQKNWYLNDLQPRQCSTCHRTELPGWRGNKAWHCTCCWVEFFDEKACDVSDNRGDFDFVEVGTSNYHTLTHACAGHPDGNFYAWDLLPYGRAPQSLRGLAVDMKQKYLDELPNLPNVQKVCAAVTEHDGPQVMFHVPACGVAKWQAIFATCGNEYGWHVMELAKACSSLGNPSILQRGLRRLGLLQLMKKTIVHAHSLPTLLTQHQVGSIGVLLMDTEGHDCAILKGFLRACASQPQWYPKWIMYETNGMNDSLFGRGTEKDMMHRLEEAGYEVHKLGKLGRNTLARRKN